MLINEILLEDDKYGRTKALSVAEFKALMPQISIALNRTERGYAIYRGSPNPNPIVYTDPNKVERVSRNTTNELTLLISHILPSWQNWPKRSRSLICSEDYSNASSYSNGGAYIVLPLGNPKIGIVPGTDFWDAFDMSPPTFNELFGEFLRTCRVILDNVVPFPKDFSTVQGMVQALKTIDAVNNQQPELMQKILEDYQSSRRYGLKGLLPLITSGNTIETLDKYFAPKINSFKLIPYNVYEHELNYEVWFSAPAVLIRKAMFDKLMN